MASIKQRRAASDRRQYAEQRGQRGGDDAYRACRRSAPGMGRVRKPVMPSEIRAMPEMHEGRKTIHTFGFFTLYDHTYPMYDQFGEYEEVVRPGSGARSLASNPDVSFLVNHAGVSMARTTNGSLVLEERREGGWHDAWLSAKRTDVCDLHEAIKDRDVDQMSFAFMIPDDPKAPGGMWSEDWTTFEILAWDIDRGDVSAVNFGASMYTDISASAPDVLNAIDRLPVGAMPAVMDRAARRAPAPNRERIVVRSRTTGAAPSVQRLEDRIARTAARYVELAERESLAVGDVVNAALPWYEIRNASGETGESDDGGPVTESDTATIIMYDDIGGSFGVDAKTFARDLEDITAPKITLRINSPGGSVRDAIAIHSSLLHHPAKVRAVVDGWAASAASIIAMAADPHDPDADSGGIDMMPGSQMMLHDASATDDGNAAEKQKMVTYLDRQSANLAEMYARRAGGTAEEWREIMLAETWAFAQESVDMGLADRVVHTREPVADADDEEKLTRSYDITRYGYRYAGRRAAPDPLQTRGDVRQRLARGEASPRLRPVVDERLTGDERYVLPADLEQVEPKRSTPEQATGRSIDSIESWLKRAELD
jgi:HK97 family phage prohead protease